MTSVFIDVANEGTYRRGNIHTKDWGKPLFTKYSYFDGADTANHMVATILRKYRDKAG